jgi:hypothetical protein
MKSNGARPSRSPGENVGTHRSSASSIPLVIRPVMRLLSEKTLTSEQIREPACRREGSPRRFRLRRPARLRFSDETSESPTELSWRHIMRRDWLPLRPHHLGQARAPRMRIPSIHEEGAPILQAAGNGVKQLGGICVCDVEMYTPPCDGVGLESWSVLLYLSSTQLTTTQLRCAQVCVDLLYEGGAYALNSGATRQASQPFSVRCLF